MTQDYKGTAMTLYLLYPCGRCVQKSLVNRQQWLEKRGAGSKLVSPSDDEREGCKKGHGALGWWRREECGEEKDRERDSSGCGGIRSQAGRTTDLWRNVHKGKGFRNDIEAAVT